MTPVARSLRNVANATWRRQIPQGEPPMRDLRGTPHTQCDPDDPVGSIDRMYCLDTQVVCVRTGSRGDVLHVCMDPGAQGFSINLVNFPESAAVFSLSASDVFVVFVLTTTFLGVRPQATGVQCCRRSSCRACQKLRFNPILQWKKQCGRSWHFA